MPNQMRHVSALAAILVVMNATPTVVAEQRPLPEAIIDWSIQSLDIQAPSDSQDRLVQLSIDGQEQVLILRPYSMRSSGFTVWSYDDSGQLAVNTDIVTPKTYRGHILGQPHSVVAATVDGNQLTAWIRLENDDIRMVEPRQRYEPAEAAEHVVYDALDVIPTGHACGNDDFGPSITVDLDTTAAPITHASLDADLARGTLAAETAEIALDADYEFYEKNGFSVQNTVDDIEFIMNGVEAIYESQFEISYDITHIIVRDDISDPYTTNDAEDLLDEFRIQWSSQHGSIQRDIAHLMTGKNLLGSTIGIAYLGGVCNSVSYGLSESKYNNNYFLRVALTAHELGHNWNASHCCGSCSGCSGCRIMCPCLGSCSGVIDSFGSSASSSISSYKNTRSCLASGAGSPLDLIEPDPGLPGQLSTLSIRGAPAGASVEFYYSLLGGTSFAGGCPGVLLDIGGAKPLTTTAANSNGIATFSIFVPPGASGLTVRLQAIETDTCTKSDVVIYSFP